MRMMKIMRMSMRRERMMNDDEFQEKISFDRIGESRGSNGVSLGTDQPRGTSALKAEENIHNTAQIHHIGRAGRALHPAK